MSENSLNLSLLLVHPTADGIRNIESFFKKMPIRYEILEIETLSKTAMKAAGEFVFILDSKMDVPLAEVIAFLTRFYSDPKLQIIVGDRFSRKTTTAWLNDFARKLFSIEAKDIFCPMKGFRKEFSDQILGTTHTQFATDVEIFIKARDLNATLQSVPVFSNQVRTSLHPIKTFFELVSLWLFANHSSRE